MFVFEVEGITSLAEIGDRKSFKNPILNCVYLKRGILYIHFLNITIGLHQGSLVNAICFHSEVHHLYNNES